MGDTPGTWICQNRCVCLQHGVNDVYIPVDATSTKWWYSLSAQVCMYNFMSNIERAYKRGESMNRNIFCSTYHAHDETCRCVRDTTLARVCIEFCATVVYDMLLKCTYHWFSCLCTYLLANIYLLTYSCCISSCISNISSWFLLYLYIPWKVAFISLSLSFSIYVSIQPNPIHSIQFSQTLISIGFSVRSGKKQPNVHRILRWWMNTPYMYVFV